MNPVIVSFIKSALPYVLAIAIGFAAGWKLQGLNLTAAENARDKATNDFAAYRTEQQRLTNEANAKADQQRQETANAWAKKIEQVLADKEAYQRCVAAGRCGPAPRVCVALPGTRPSAGAEAAAISPRGGIDEPAGGGAVPPAASTAAVSDEPNGIGGLIEDCARTQLKLNTLRDDIRKQPSWEQ